MSRESWSLRILYVPEWVRTAAAPASGEFAHTTVEQQVWGEEPRAVSVPGTNTVFVVAPILRSGTSLWKSTDGGRTFGPGVNTNQGSGDSDAAVDPSNPSVVY